RIAARAGGFVVDDAAQTVGIESGGRVLGGCGDVGIQSFAQSKSLVTGGRGSGGIFFVNNPRLEAAAKAICSALPPSRGRLAQFAYFIWQYLLSPHMGPLQYYAARAANKLAQWAAGDDYFEPGRMSNLEAAIAEQQLQRLTRL